jgi:hypothetical protein
MFIELQFYEKFKPLSLALKIVFLEKILRRVLQIYAVQLGSEGLKMQLSSMH